MTDYQGARVCLYARTSAAQQAGNDLPISDQVERLKIWCEKNGAVIADIVAESGASGTNADRSRFQSMIAAATRKERPYDVILVDSLSRLFRHPKTLVENIAVLERSNIRIVAVAQAFDDNVVARPAAHLFDES